MNCSASSRRNSAELLLALFFLCCGAFRLEAQSIQTILSNGPVSNRFNIVFLSEGYTSAQLPQFRVDSTNMLNALLAHMPYQAYSNCFNAYAISVASTQSGSDHPAYGLSKNTYFNSTYDAISDYLITFPTDSTGQGKVDSLLQTYMPNCHLAILLVNDVTPGGSDGIAKTALAAIGPSIQNGSDILAHETGHVAAGLGDEYTSAYPGFPDIEEPNTTRETRPAFIKWKAWIDPATPIPTPPTSDYSATVGLFQGAHYHTTNWYRPKLDCAMNHLGAPFCEICSESLVLAFYSHLRPIDSFSPASTNLSIATNQLLNFQVSILQPCSHSLLVQWSTNGSLVPDATNAAFSIAAGTFSNGSNCITVAVHDPTSLVRTDPTNLLSQTAAWGLTVSIPYLKLDSAAWVAKTNFSLRVTGYAPQGFCIQSSSNLINWVSSSTNTLSGGQAWFTNANASAQARKFYRAVTPPL